MAQIFNLLRSLDRAQALDEIGGIDPRHLWHHPRENRQVSGCDKSKLESNAGLEKSALGERIAKQPDGSARVKLGGARLTRSLAHRHIFVDECTGNILRIVGLAIKMASLHPYPMGPDIIDLGLLLESLNLQITNDCSHRPIMGHNDESSTGTPPVSRNPWKRAGSIFYAFRLGQNKGIKPLLCHQPLCAAPVKKSGNQSAYFVVRL